MYNFDTCPDRTGTNSIKYDKLTEYFGRNDLLPLWVADMEFESAPCIREALRKIADHGVYGYFAEPDGYKESIIRWMKEIQGWDVKKEWITYSPAVLRGMSFVLFHFTRPGDKILVQPPVYPPFMNLTRDNGRTVVYNPLKRHDSEIHNGGGHVCRAHEAYSFDFEQFERITAENEIKLLILGNPHNPGGIRWSREDLIKIADICSERHILIISDEIHADLNLWGERHIPFASVSPQAAEISITFGAPSKTFNIPGLCSSFMIIPNPELREEFYHYLTVNEFNWPMINTTMATIAAYSEGNPWRVECLNYIESNIKLVESHITAHQPEIKVIRPDASYLVWLDCREFAHKVLKASTGKEDRILSDFFTNHLRIALNNGAQFGPGGDGFIRLNAACPRSMLAEALTRISSH